VALDGRLREIANGCFVEAKHEGAVAARQTALEKPDGQKWVVLCRLHKMSRRGGIAALGRRAQCVKVYSLPALGHTNVTMRLRLLAGGE
jgi:hypothetical protein